MTKIRPSWDEVYMGMAATVARRSRCTRAEVGAVLVTTDNRVAAACYNGPPPNHWPSEYNENNPASGKFCDSWCPRAKAAINGLPLDPGYLDCPSVHAESNAIARSVFSETSGGTLYVTSTPCMHCAKAAAAAQIGAIVLVDDPNDAHRNPSAVFEFLANSRIIVRQLHHV